MIGAEGGGGVELSERLDKQAMYVKKKDIFCTMTLYTV